MSPEVGSSRHGAGFWLAVVGGGLVMAVATWGAFDSLSTSSFGSWGKWIIGLDLLNDALILPVVALVCVGLGRLQLGRSRAPVQAGLFATVIVLAVVWPCLAGLSASNNSTIQPLDYTTATLTVLGVVWAGVAVWGLLRRTPADGADGR